MKSEYSSLKCDEVTQSPKITKGRSFLDVTPNCLFSFFLIMMLGYQINPFPRVSNMSQSQSAVTEPVSLPLTTLSEDERMFRASVREFAEGELRPRVEQMDEHGKMDPALIKQCFGLGLMGIETPEEFGGAG